MSRISVVCPCFNEEDNVDDLHRRISAVFARWPHHELELLFIDNASTDGTAARLRELAAQDPRVRVILNARNFGHIRSPMHAVLQATGAAVIPMASDLQDPPEMLDAFIAGWERGYKKVVAVKPVSRENRVAFGLRKVFYGMLNRISEIPLIENFTGFGLYDRAVIDYIAKLDDPYPYFRGLVSEIGYDTLIVEFDQPRRLRGVTKNNFYTLYDIAMLGITNHSKLPLRVATMGGFAMSALSFCVALVYLVYKLVNWYAFDVGQAPLVIGLFFLFSVQLFFIGLLGEYVLAIHRHVLHRPLVVEKERINFLKRMITASPVEPTTRIEALALAYLALPTIVFLAGWIVAPLGLVAALALVIVVAAVLLPSRGRWAPGPGPLLLPVAAVALLWTVMGGVGHFAFANPDWVVRDAVLRDLVVDRWPVAYRLGGVDTLLRAPIGYFLPAALCGKLFGLRAAELALLAWTTAGVALVFAMMLRDRPTPRAAMIRIVVFIAFSGMDIVGTLAHYDSHALGDHLEWWAFMFQYSSQTTQLFWVPNHALPGWIAVAWLLGRDLRRLPVAPAVLFVLLVPIWSPLTAIGIAPLIGTALLVRFGKERVRTALFAFLDWKVVVATLVCLSLVYPYLTAGSDQVASGASSDMRWVGEQIVPRYIEFVLFEFAGFAVLLLRRDRRDALLWAAVVVLLALPLYRFGPYNDLAMRGSIAPLTLLAIRIGNWLSTPRVFARGALGAGMAAGLLVIGAVTPLMEVARVFIEPVWAMNQDAAVPDVTRGTHYLTPRDQPWLQRFVAPSFASSPGRSSIER